ncbi:hypothetical protein VDG1235_4886 [Verrucomicrobiia bacterium DG1235]|nr:hypothetical protein VDG1235_4886 [Verrucomicrobiae bacterium DG1235]
MRPFKTIPLICLLTTCLSPLCSGHDCSFEHDETISFTKEFTFDPNLKHREIVVDNISGSIDVEGYDGEIVKLEVKRLILARSESRLAVAQKEVWLDTREDGDAVIISVEGPFRGDSGKVNYRGCRYYGYTNQFDMRILVPKDTEIYLSTVNDGDLSIQGTSGKFDLKNVNGSISAKNVTGSGNASTINGPVSISFLNNPEDNCHFHSINGHIDIAFRPSLNADLFFKTMNGEVYSDFEVSGIPPSSAFANKKKDNHAIDGVRTYRGQDSNGVRAGKGGPRISFETLNGNMIIKKVDTVN